MILRASVWGKNLGMLAGLQGGRLAQFDLAQRRFSLFRTSDASQLKKSVQLRGFEFEGAIDLAINALAVTGQGKILVLLSDLQEIAVFSDTGDFLRQFRLPIKAFSGLILCGSGSGESIWVNSIDSEWLIHAYDLEGRLRRKFGQSPRFSQGDPLTDLAGSREIGKLWSPAYLACLAGESVVLGFKHLPVVQLYSATGDLTWEQRLDELEPIQKAMKRFKADGTSCDNVRYQSFGHRVPVFVEWLVSDGEVIWVFLKSRAVVRLQPSTDTMELFYFPEQSKAVVRQASVSEGTVFVPIGASVMRLEAKRSFSSRPEASTRPSRGN